MIIKREFVAFKQLINSDPDAKKLILAAIQNSYGDMDDKRREEWLCVLMQKSLSQRDMGWCMTGIGELIDGFEKLDKEKPYDNGFTYNDVQRIDMIDWDETGITVQLINVFDGEESIVSIERIGRKA